ncbi:MAG TPA: hypothetical protein DEQ47_12090 [Solibacterales bacterium]|nr:hypothetical protein [Bryobacterales bacterium]
MSNVLNQEEAVEVTSDGRAYIKNANLLFREKSEMDRLRKLSALAQKVINSRRAARKRNESGPAKAA